VLPAARRNRLPLSWFLALAIASTTTPAAGADTAEETTASSVAYHVTVDAPSPLKERIEREVGIVRWQGFAGMTDDLLDRLAHEAIEETRNLAAAEGWFSPKIDVAIDRKTTPPNVTLSVVTGEPTRIANVKVDVTGPATTDAPRGTDTIARVQSGWGLPVGMIFRQSAWTAAKDQAVATLTSAQYAAAKIAHSEAFIDPALYAGDLTVELESGPPFYFGPLLITGLKRYAESVVRNFSTIEPGDPYDERELLRFVRRLNASGYFASAQAAVDPNPEHADAAPVNVAVIEAPPKRFEGGIGYSTDVEFRGNVSYRDVDLDSHGLQMLIEGRLESLVQSASIRFTQPPNDAQWIGTYSAGAERTDIEGLITRTANFGTRWHTVEERNERALSGTYYLDEQQPSGQETSRSHAVYLAAERYWRRTDDLLAPTTGWMAMVEAGGGVPGVSTRGFGRVIGRFAAWQPLTPKDELEFRAQGGAVLAPTSNGIPSVLLFRTGGDTTVRGYEFESLGVQSDGTTLPGRYYAVFNVEGTHWIGESWGIAAFVDAGNATDTPRDTHLALGYGMGLRVRSPLGPFRVDLAYGQDVHRFRVHLSVGLSF